MMMFYSDSPVYGTGGFSSTLYEEHQYETLVFSIVTPDQKRISP
jgi:hypothetical protein